MELEVLAGKQGDCLLLHGGTEANPNLILIDGGPAGVWEDSLLPRLTAIRAERKLTAQQPLVIDLVVVSHVDDDHINGVIRLLKSMLDAQTAKAPKFFRIDRLWHNSFDMIIGNDQTAKTIGAAPTFGLASLGGDVDAQAREEEPGEGRDAALVFASIEQGDNLRRLAKALKIEINPDFGGSLVAAQPSHSAPAAKFGEIDLIVAGPLHDDLQNLQRDHDAWLKDHPERVNDPEALFASIADKSVANLSSIVLVARDASGKTILLTGDASGAKVVEGLETIGLKKAGEPFALDVLKMPHHGSIRNVDATVIDALPAHAYVFSGNGKYCNPDRETFDLIQARRPDVQMEWVVSYRIKDIDPLRKDEFEKERKKKQAKGKPPGPAWSPKTNALATLLVPPPAGVTLRERSTASIVVKP